MPHELGTHLRRLRLRNGHHTHFNPWIVFVNRAPTCAAPASALICLRRPAFALVSKSPPYLQPMSWAPTCAAPASALICRSTTSTVYRSWPWMSSAGLDSGACME